MQLKVTEEGEVEVMETTIEEVMEQFHAIPEAYQDVIRNMAKDAIDHIKEHGWIQGDFHTKNGFCAIGAIQKARYENQFHLDIPAADRNAVMNIDEFNSYVMSYNDAKLRTEEDVLMLLKTVAYG